MNIVIAAVPYVDTTEPIMAPAVLKASLKEFRNDAVAIDLNIDIVNMIHNHARKQQILDFFFSQIVHNEVIDDISSIIRHCSDKILERNPDVVALSLLIYSCQIFTRWLCADIRNKNPNIKIVIGGSGIKKFIAETNTSFCIQLKELRLIDDYIVGDGELSFYEYISGNYSYPGINSSHWEIVPDLDLIPFPDYSDYDFNLYPKKVIPILDSKGCIKNCEFCDIIEHWTKFQSRTAPNIFSEMLVQIQKHNLLSFSFRDSLINGNVKEFKKLMDLISDYNRNKPMEQQITWEGYFIIRQEKYCPPELWSKMKESNGTLLVGIESVIPTVRRNLGKTFDNIDIDYHLEMGRRYQVPLVLLFIVAYPTETINDFNYTKNWFIERKQYANDSVGYINLSFASILPNTQLDRKANEYSIKKGKLPSIWINQNLNITTEQRKQYIIELYKLCTDLGFVVGTNTETLEHSNDEYC